jgi:hypothetical protein
MNLQCYPRGLLLKFKREMEQAEPVATASSRGASAPISNEAGTLITPACCTGEPGDIEVVTRIKLSANDAALVGTPCLDPQAVKGKRCGGAGAGFELTIGTDTDPGIMLPGW